MTKRSVTTGLLPKPKAGIWPPPVYEMVVRDKRLVTAHTTGRRRVRMSFWSAEGKPINGAGKREFLAKYHASGRQVIDGFIEHDGKRWRDPFFTTEESLSEIGRARKRRTIKETREALAALLACLDGETVDHDAIRAAVVHARAMAA